MRLMRRALDLFWGLLGAVIIGFFNGWKYVHGITEDEYLDKNHPEGD